MTHVCKLNIIEMQNGGKYASVCWSKHQQTLSCQAVYILLVSGPKAGAG